MPETFREFFARRGGLGVLVILKEGPQRFSELNDRLYISTSTLSKRLGEARDLGLVTPEIDERETSVREQYRVTERGQFVVEKMDRLGIVHAYRTMLDMQGQVEEGKAELVEWVQDEETQPELARRSDTDPYIDPFGENVTEPAVDDSELDYGDEEFFTKE